MKLLPYAILTDSLFHQYFVQQVKQDLVTDVAYEEHRVIMIEKHNLGPPHFF